MSRGRGGSEREKKKEKVDAFKRQLKHIDFSSLFQQNTYQSIWGLACFTNTICGASLSYCNRFLHNSTHLLPTFPRITAVIHHVSSLNCRINNTTLAAGRNHRLSRPVCVALNDSLVQKQLKKHSLELSRRDGKRVEVWRGAGKRHLLSFTGDLCLRLLILLWLF